MGYWIARNRVTACYPFDPRSKACAYVSMDFLYVNLNTLTRTMLHNKNTTSSNILYALFTHVCRITIAHTYYY